MSQKVLENYLTETIAAFRAYKKMAEKTFNQVEDDEFFIKIDEESNSVALIVKHIAGNLRSRWTDFLTTDGEKPDRRRDTEFEKFEIDSRKNLMEFWETGWQAALASLESLRVEDLDKLVQIRGEDFTVVRAVTRSLAHTAYHVGQIAFLAKHFRAHEWQTLSVPRGKSEEFAAYLQANKNKADYLDAPQSFAETLKSDE